MERTMSSNYSKENRSSTGPGFLPACNRTAIDFNLASLIKRIGKLKSAMGQGISENQALISGLKSKFEHSLQQSADSVEEEANKLQALQVQIVSRSREKGIETAQADRALVSQFQTKKVCPRAESVCESNNENVQRQAHEISLMEQRVSSLGHIHELSKRNSEEDMFVAVGDCQSQMDTMEQSLREYDRRSTESLSLIEDRIEDICCSMDSSIQKEFVIGRKDNLLIENLVEKLINKMTAL